MSQPPLGILAAAVEREDLAPKRKRKRTAFKTKGRERSKNIEDQRSYFGSDALDPDYYYEDRQQDFLRDTLHNPHSDAPQKFVPKATRRL